MFVSDCKGDVGSLDANAHIEFKVFLMMILKMGEQWLSNHYFSQNINMLNIKIFIDLSLLCSDYF